MKATVIILSLFISFAAFADDPGLPGGDPDVPIDAGTGVLLAAGIAYGLRQVKRKGIEKEGP